MPRNNTAALIYGLTHPQELLGGAQDLYQGARSKLARFAAAPTAAWDTMMDTPNKLGPMGIAYPDTTSAADRFKQHYKENKEAGARGAGLTGMLSDPLLVAGLGATLASGGAAAPVVGRSALRQMGAAAGRAAAEGAAYGAGTQLLDPYRSQGAKDIGYAGLGGAVGGGILSTGGSLLRKEGLNRLPGSDGSQELQSVMDEIGGRGAFRGKAAMKDYRDTKYSQAANEASGPLADVTPKSYNQQFTPAPRDEEAARLGLFDNPRFHTAGGYFQTDVLPAYQDAYQAINQRNILNRAQQEFNTADALRKYAAQDEERYGGKGEMFIPGSEYAEGDIRREWAQRKFERIHGFEPGESYASKQAYTKARLDKLRNDPDHLQELSRVGQPQRVDSYRNQSVIDAMQEGTSAYKNHALPVAGMEDEALYWTGPDRASLSVGNHGPDAVPFTQHDLYRNAKTGIPNGDGYWKAVEDASKLRTIEPGSSTSAAQPLYGGRVYPTDLANLQKDQYPGAPLKYLLDSRLNEDVAGIPSLAGAAKKFRAGQTAQDALDFGAGNSYTDNDWVRNMVMNQYGGKLARNAGKAVPTLGQLLYQSQGGPDKKKNR